MKPNQCCLHNTMIENYFGIFQCVCTINEDKIIRIQKWYLFWKRQRVLWRIADYYTARKYAPENVLKYIDLEA